MMDTLTIADDLIEAGLAEKVAKKQAHILGDFFGKLATKEDVRGLEAKLVGKMDKMESWIKCGVITGIGFMAALLTLIGMAVSRLG